MGFRDKKRNQKRVLLRRSAGSKTVRGVTSCRWRGKSRGSGRRSNRRSRRVPVLYIGHIPHSFYEDQMQGFFQQPGAVKKRVRIARNRKVSYIALQGMARQLDGGRGHLAETVQAVKNHGAGALHFAAECKMAEVCEYLLRMSRWTWMPLTKQGIVK